MKMIGLVVLGCSIAGTAAAAAADEPPPSSAQPAPLVSPRDVDRAVQSKINDAKLTDTGVEGGVDPAILRAEIMLDRVHDSPGVIDGKAGGNFEHALEAFEKHNHLKVTKTLGKEAWDLLLKQAGKPVLVDHRLTDAEVAGPFFPDLPKDYARLAAMKAMGYRSVAQKLGAQFHMSEDLLAALNPGIDLGKAGGHILVADTDGAPVRGKLARIFVDKRKSQVLGYDRKGNVLVALPATIGSRELPSPSGTYKVKGVAWNPVYYYDPKNFVQGDNHDKLQLPPGPNNPVGSVFIALTKPTYGLHGTPDPSSIDKTASHGCVRMTNWDASDLAHLVRPGIKVSFGRSSK